jgi:ketosteroid isomerase-like protein
VGGVRGTVSSEVALRRFIRMVNDHDVRGMASLMAKEHLFTDALGATVSGREEMVNGWAGYFKWFPDYKIEIQETYRLEDTFVMLGFASGSYAGSSRGHWRLPAAWRAVMRRGRVKEWSVYCDTKVPQEAIEKGEAVLARHNRRS